MPSACPSAHAHEPLTSVALQEHAEDVIGAAVQSVRSRTGVDRAFAAVAGQSGVFPMTERDGLTDPRWAHVVVRAGRGLGGRVAAECRPVFTPDYLDDGTLTTDYLTVVRAEGLRALGCVPIFGPEGVAALLYAGDRRKSGLGGRLLDELLRVAEVATVGLVLTTERSTADRTRTAISTIARRGVASADPAVLRQALTSILSACDGLPSRRQSSIRLTPREHDVLEMLADGASNREIATQLVLSEPTVKGYVRAVREKLGASSRLDAVARARREGLV
jgi:LuxR family transcriptional regulator, regulator of acetate metabolism